MRFRDEVVRQSGLSLIDGCLFRSGCFGCWRLIELVEDCSIELLCVEFDLPVPLLLVVKNGGNLLLFFQKLLFKLFNKHPVSFELVARLHRALLPFFLKFLIAG